MKCSNKDCGHVFFEKEEDYICCPVCGDIQEESLPQNGFLGANIIAQHYKLKKIVKITSYLLTLIIIYLFFEFFLYMILEHKHIITNRSAGVIKNFNRATMIITVIYLFFFLYLHEKTVFLKKIIGEKAYYLDTPIFKLLKWLFQAFVLYLIVFHILPLVKTFFHPKFVKVRHNLRNLDLGIALISLRLFLFSLILILIDILELRKRKICRDMVKSAD